MGERVVKCRNIKTGAIIEAVESALIWRPSAYGLVVKDDAILINRFWDRWSFPGGGIEPGETIETGLLREVEEETGVKVTKGPLLDIAEAFLASHREDGIFFHCIMYYFLCSDPVGEVSDAGFAEYEKADMQKAEWVPLSDAQHLTFNHPTQSQGLIQDVMRKI